VSTIDPGRMNLAPHQNPAALENSGVIYITGSLFFGAVDEFNQRMRAAYDLDHIILSLRGMSNVDVSGAQSMLELCEDLHKHGKTVAFCGVNEHVRTYFDRAGITNLLGENAYYWSADRAILDLLNKA
jgi:SulP family sulfate permease